LTWPVFSPIWLIMTARIVTFLSDFGLQDGYVAQVKARILSLLPGTVMVDITHGVAPYDVMSAAWVLTSTYPYFPAGTIHLCIVDPGVGSSRAVLALEKGGHLFVGPDNGIFSFIYPADSVTEVDWRPSGPISPTFHGRDLFAPIVGEILKGAHPGSLGHPSAQPVSFDLSRDMVVHIDRFGTLVTTIPCERLKPGCSLKVGGSRISTVARTFSDIPDLTLALVCGSGGTVEVAMNRGSAAQALGAHVGLAVFLETASQRE
jgi:S-adenosyl-L-methionine hydrolase (adenosine-forming)